MRNYQSVHFMQKKQVLYSPLMKYRFFQIVKNPVLTPQSNVLLWLLSPRLTQCSYNYVKDYGDKLNI